MHNSSSIKNTSKNLSVGKLLHAKSRIGFDLGDTIVHMQYGPRGIPIENAFETIKQIVAFIGSKNAFIVSRVHIPKGELRSRAWLKEQNFHEHTGLPEENLRYCMERDAKAPICKKLGLTHFIDNRPEVLFHLKGIVSERILFCPQPIEVTQWKEEVSEMTHVSDWKSIGTLLLPKPSPV